MIQKKLDHNIPPLKKTNVYLFSQEKVKIAAQIATVNYKFRKNSGI